ncbi:MAG: lytic transglycosylase domain-containing protein, partial [Myxococcota bacterium]|nr:lytic transglycosylase domain-containing protein [Myxococcota bacterium]
DYFAALAFARLSAIGADKASELSTRLRPAPADLSQRLAQLQDPKRLANASYQRAIAFSRMGRYEWVEAEAKRAGDELGEQDSIPWLMLALQEQLGAVKASHRAASLALGDATSCLTPTDCERWALAYPRPFASLVEEHASKQQLSTELVYGIMREESGFDPRIESYANARGLMQLMLPTAESTASSLSLPKPTAASLFEPETAIPLGVGYLAKLASLFGGNEGLVMAGYNGGQGAVGKWLEERPQEPFDLWVEGIPYGQTRHYVKRVLSNAWTYRWLYEAEIQASFDPATPVSTLAGLP